MQSRRKFFETLSKRSVVAAAAPSVLSTILASCDRPSSNFSVVDKTIPVAQPEHQVMKIIAGTAHRPSTGFSDYHRVQVGDDIIIHASHLKLEAALVSPIHNLIVYADTVQLKDSVTLHSRRLFIHAREIDLNNKELNVGGKGAPEFDTAALGIPNLAAKGANGATGRRGDDAGEIVMIAESFIGNGQLKANGGQGGMGQKGGDGGKGLPGIEGRRADCNSNSTEGIKHGSTGEKGGKGGEAGTGGLGGEGGEAGSIKLYYIKSPNPRNILIELKGGMGGDGGSHGLPGEGGTGGIGGVTYRARYGPRESTHCERTNRRGPTGPTGDWGDIPAPSSNGITKLDKPVDACMENCSYSFIANHASISQLALTLHNTTLNYINSEFKSCATSLAWLAALANNRNSPAEDNLIRPVFTSISGVAKADEWRSMANCVEALIAQMKSGLDFYGYPKNYVPVLSTAEYESTLLKMFPIAAAIEESHEKYWKNLASAEIQLQSIYETIQSTDSIIANINSQIGGIDSLATKYKNSVEELDLTILKLEAEMLRAGESFKKAIQDQAGGKCPIGSILKLAAAVAITVYSGGTAAPAIAASASALETAEKFKDIVKNVKEIATQINNVQKSIAELQKAYAEFKNDIDKSAAATKLIMNGPEFDELFNKFKNLSQAKAYKRKIENFQKACNTRNEKLFEYTSLVVKREALRAETELQRSQIERLKSVWAKSSNPNLVEWEVFMESQLFRAKEILLRTIYETSKAYEYWALQPASFGQLNDLNVASLHSTFLEFIRGQSAARNAQGSNPLPFEAKVVIEEDEMSLFFDQSKNLLDISFYIDPESGAFGDNPNWKHVLVRNVDVKINGINNKRGLKIEITHGGSVQIVSERTHYFSHQPRNTSIAYDDSGIPEAGHKGDNLGGDNKTFIDLSPFAFWKMKVRHKDPIKINRINRVELNFQGLFRA